MDFVNEVVVRLTDPFRIIFIYAFGGIFLSLFAYLTISSTKGTILKILAMLIIAILASAFFPLVPDNGKLKSMVGFINGGYLNFTLMALGYLVSLFLILVWQSKQMVLAGLGVFLFGYIFNFIEYERFNNIVQYGGAGDLIFLLYVLLPIIIFMMFLALYITHHPVNERKKLFKNP